MKGDLALDKAPPDSTAPDFRRTRTTLPGGFLLAPPARQNRRSQATPHPAQIQQPEFRDEFLRLANRYGPNIRFFVQTCRPLRMWESHVAHWRSSQSAACCPPAEIADSVVWFFRTRKERPQRVLQATWPDSGRCCHGIASCGTSLCRIQTSSIQPGRTEQVFASVLKRFRQG